MWLVFAQTWRTGGVNMKQPIFLCLLPSPSAVGLLSPNSGLFMTPQGL